MQFSNADLKDLQGWKGVQKVTDRTTVVAKSRNDNLLGQAEVWGRTGRLVWKSQFYIYPGSNSWSGLDDDIAIH